MLPAAGVDLAAAAVKTPGFAEWPPSRIQRWGVPPRRVGRGFAPRFGLGAGVLGRVRSMPPVWARFFVRAAWTGRTDRGRSWRQSPGRWLAPCPHASRIGAQWRERGVGLGRKNRRTRKAGEKGGEGAPTRESHNSHFYF